MHFPLFRLSVLMVLPLAIAVSAPPAWGTAAKQSSPEEALLEEEGVLEDGDTLLPSDNSLYDSYTFEGQAGQRVRITLESTEFDAFLILVGPDEQSIAQNDDVATNNFNAELVVTLPSDGTYTILANSYNSSGRGRYALTVRPAAEEAEPETFDPAPSIEPTPPASEESPEQS